MMRELMERHLLWPLSGGYVEALLSKYNRDLSLTCTLMKSNAKAKSFHVVWGNPTSAKNLRILPVLP